MRSRLKTARSFGLLGVALLLAGASAGIASAKESGDGPNADPTKKERFVWIETRDAFEFASAEELKASRDTRPRDTRPKDTRPKDTSCSQSLGRQA